MAGATAFSQTIRLSGKNLAAAVSNPSKLDILQVVNEGGKVVWNLTSAGIGTATVNPAHPTNGALLGQYFGSSFKAAFSNPSNLDVLNVVNPNGGGSVMRLTSAGLVLPN
jgi:hypothetical protein